jgi:predicted nuclease of predicted toxin-antitoxin system
MKFFIDQDVYDVTIRFLRNRGHDVVTANDLSLSRAEDIELLKIARETNRILITRDRDYGNLVFIENEKSGVIYLRVLPSTLSVIHKELEKVLSLYSENDLLNAFTTIEAGRHRFRKI